MKKITLLGDSIRQIGYGTKVPEVLAPDFTVFQPDDNCRFSAYTLRGLHDWADGIRGSVAVHWNNGLWDDCDLFGDGSITPIDIYVQTMVRIATLLKQRAPVVIFATTTPVRPDQPYHTNEVIRAFNDALVPELVKRGVIINDLHAAVARDIDRYIRADDKIHLTEDGIALTAAQVADCIRRNTVGVEPFADAVKGTV